MDGSYNLSASYVPSKLDNISDQYYRGASNQISWQKAWGWNSPSFLAEFYKTLPTQKRIFLTFQNYWHLELQHMCICQYNKYNSKTLYSTVYVCGSYHLSVWVVPWIFMISQTTSIWGASKCIGWKQECGVNSPSFWGEFCKTLPTQNRIFLTFLNYWNLDLSHFCICSYGKYNSKKFYSNVYVHGSYHLSVWEVPEMFMISQTPSVGGHENTWDGSRNVEETLPVFGRISAKPFLLKIGYF